MSRSLGVADSGDMQKYVTLNYIATLVTQKFFVAPRKLLVVAINGATRVAGTGGACTLSFYKAASAIAVGSGTLLHSGTFNVVGTADTNQPLTLSTTDGALILNTGDSLGYVLSGTATSAVGSVTVTLEPI